MARNMIETVMGAVVLLVAVVFVVVAFKSSGLSASTGYQVTARFNDASGLTVGTEVRMAGVKIDTVAAQDVDWTNFTANVTLTLNEDAQLPVDSSARILPDGLLGGNFVAVEPGAEEELLRSGSRIEHTQSAINLIDLIARTMFSGGNQ